MRSMCSASASCARRASSAAARAAASAASAARLAASARSARAVAAAMLADGRVDLDWPVGSPPALTQGRVRVLLNLMLVAAECLPTGGTVRIGAGAGEGARIQADGAGARLDEPLSDGLGDEIATRELESRAACARLARHQLATLGARLDISLDTDAIRFDVDWA